MVEFKQKMAFLEQKSVKFSFHTLNSHGAKIIFTKKIMSKYYILEIRKTKQFFQLICKNSKKRLNLPFYLKNYNFTQKT